MELLVRKFWKHNEWETVPGVHSFETKCSLFLKIKHLYWGEEHPPKYDKEGACIGTSVSTKKIFLFHSGATRVGFVGGSVKFLKAQKELYREHSELRMYSALEEVCLGYRALNLVNRISSQLPRGRVVH